MVNDDDVQAAKKGKGRGLNQNKARGGKQGKAAGNGADHRATGQKKRKPSPISDPIQATVVNKRAFIARVAEACDLSSAQVRVIVEATLAEMGSAFAAGETLALPPFGKARVSRQKTIEGGEVLTLRLRRPDATADRGSSADDD